MSGMLLLKTTWLSRVIPSLKLHRIYITKFYSDQSVTQNRRNKVLHPNGVPPPKGDPSWEWFEVVESNEEINKVEADFDEERDEPKRGTKEIKFAKFGNRMVEIPIPLKESITDKLKNKSMHRIRENALRIFASNTSLANVSSQAPKAKESSPKDNRTRAALEFQSPHTLTYGTEETLAYIASVLPSYYASAHKVLSELKARYPEFRPSRLLDFGTGPGTSLWAAREIWPEEAFSSIRGIDLSEPMLDMANSLISHGEHFSKELQNRIRFERHFSYSPGEAKHDLVIASHVLSEFSSDALRIKAIETLWEQCADTLVVIEKGTPKGFHIMGQVRTLLSNSESHIMAPCSHDKACPMAGSSRWCHFQQRLQRPRFMMDVKKAKSNLEFGAYSYIIIRRGKRPEMPKKPEVNKSDDFYLQSTYHWGRIVDQPSKRGSHAHIKTCSTNGTLENKVYTKSQGSGIYRDARKAHWGDLFPHKTSKVTTDATPIDKSED